MLFLFVGDSVGCDVGVGVLDEVNGASSDVVVRGFCQSIQGFDFDGEDLSGLFGE